MCKSSQIISTLVECRQYKDSIMTKIINLLAKHKIESTPNDTNSEIYVNSKNLSEINSIINDELDIPSNVIDVLIDVYQTKKGIYIRLKFK